MDTTLEITSTNGEYRVDSRVLAAHLGYEHKVLAQAIRRHKESLERKSFSLQFEAKTTMDEKGRGRPETYYMLNERQCLILTGRLKKGVEAEEWHDALVDAFLQARERVRQLETQQRQPTSPIHTLTEMFRPRALENLLSVPDGYFSVMGELFKHLYNAEAMLNRSLDEHAMIEISVGLRWSRYAREALGVPDHLKCKYPHICHGGRIEQVWAYPVTYVSYFDKWLWNEYFSREFPDYERYRARHLALPASQQHPHRKAQLAQKQAIQQPLLFDK